MQAVKAVTDILTAMGAKPIATTNGNTTVIKVNAPNLNKVEKSCETCKNLANCKKEIGIIWGFCNTDYIPKEESNE